MGNMFKEVHLLHIYNEQEFTRCDYCL